MTPVDVPDPESPRRLTTRLASGIPDGALLLAALLTAVFLVAPDKAAAWDRTSATAPLADGGVPVLTATVHPPLPARLADYWLVPDRAIAGASDASRTPGASAAERFARGAALITNGDFAAGLALIDPAALSSSPLSSYAQYYRALALIGLSRLPEADSALATAAAAMPAGYLRQGLALRIAEVAAARQDYARALETLDRLLDTGVSHPEEVLLQVARLAEESGRRDRALQAYRRVYYEHPLSMEASDAQSGLERLEALGTLTPDRIARELARAEILFNARRWAQSRAAFELLERSARGDTKELVSLRIAECDYYLDRFRQARNGVRPYLDGSREAEARFFYLTATRALGDQAGYLKLAREFLRDFPNGPWAEETLNNLASHYVIVDEDEQADVVFREILLRMPASQHAERAAWNVGWRLYRRGAFADAADVFERAAAAYPRADYRPAWLYWSGRAREQAGQRGLAADRYRLAVVDYGGSYYGRLAGRLLGARDAEAGAEGGGPPAAALQTAEPIATDALIRELVALRLYDDALREVQYAQRAWGDSPQLQATVAFIRYNQGLGLKGTERFTAIRGAINTMRRAYPQFMTAGGEDLPPEVLRIIFPIDFWPLITKYSKAHNLDPYLIAALIAQESTFTPEIRSHANAYGLMQLVPDAGRQYARKLGMRYSLSLLTRPEPNVRMGLRYFKDLVERFGGIHYALAGYNAGPARVAEWLDERPPMPQDEFIDDIPFQETRNYVKRILGTAEDYRRLYGGGLLDPRMSLTAGAAASTRERSGR